MKWRVWVPAIGAVIVLMAAALWTMGLLPPGSLDRPPTLLEAPPLPPTARSSLIVTPVVIPLSAIRDAIEQEVPRDLSNQTTSNSSSVPNVPSLPLDWSLAREPFAIAGGSGALTLSSTLRGSLQASAAMMGPQGGPPGGSPSPNGGVPGPPGAIPPPGGFLGAPPPGFFRGPPGFPSPFGGPPSWDGRQPTTQHAQPQTQSGNTAYQSIGFNGQITLTSRPDLRPEWRLNPNLTAAVSIGEAQLTLMGSTVNLSDQLKPVAERIISAQVAAFQTQTANSPVFERGVREQWAKLCRTIPLGSGPPGTPDLWLELRPIRALAGQPRIDETAVTLTIGMRAETRVITAETKPDCPFPAQLDIVPQMDQGEVNVDLPIDIPFTEVDRLIEAQLKGMTFPLDQSGAFIATVRSAKLQASGDRLLISLGIRANETKTWLGLGADATVHIWGRPVLDRAQQQLHFDYVELDVQSEAAFGALGFAARPAIPHLQKALADHAQIDLSPLVANARNNIERAISDFRQDATGTQIDAQVVDVRLTGIEFDAKTVRVIASAEGSVRVTVNKLSDK
jgi:hypothetical protein